MNFKDIKTNNLMSFFYYKIKMEELKMNKEINNKITYHQEGDYLIPDLKIPEVNPKYKHKSIEKYGQLRLNYLKEYDKVLYTELLIENKLKELFTIPSHILLNIYYFYILRLFQHLLLEC
jgi:hypothetical protein